MNSRWMSVSATALLVCSFSVVVQAFSFGQLFPASRAGPRGSLLRLGLGSHNSGLKGQLQTAVNQATNKVPHKTSAIQKKPISPFQSWGAPLSLYQSWGSAMVETTTAAPVRRVSPVTNSPLSPFQSWGSASSHVQSWASAPLETTTAAPVRRVSPVTNSPIFYIQMPPSPYVYTPGIGYVSRPTTFNAFSFLRPDVNFVSNAKPHGVYTYTTKAPHPTRTPTTTTTTPRPTTTTTTTTTTPAPVPANKPTNSPIKWLKGPWYFNGRPNNMFIFNSAYNPGHFDTLHSQYKKPGRW